MNEIKERKTLYIFEQFIFVLFLALTLFVPALPILSNLTLNIAEILIPIMFILWIINCRIVSKKYLIFLIIFIAYILLCLFINFSNQSLSDFFEVYKLGKYAILFLFFGSLFEKNPKILDKTICIFLPLLLVFNLLHYFNIFGFNEAIEPFYAYNLEHLTYFGYDSLGNPGTKRMIGTAGNPNVNGVLFLFFTAYFLSKLDTKKINKYSILLALSIIGLILCQSRTSLVAAIVILILNFLLKKHTLKNISLIAIIIGAAVLTAIIFSNLSLDYYANTHIKPQDNNSLRGRFEVWQYLFEMVKEKPVFGYGPYKQYFYQNEIYSESEYILYLWRYGIIGLLMYITWIIIPLWKNLKAAAENRFYILIAVAIMITAITNNPLTNQMILPLFAIATSQFYSEQLIKTS